MADLVSLARAKQNPALASVDPAQLQSLISAASDEIKRYCHREFVLQNYSEWYSRGPYIKEPLNLRQFPVTRVAGIYTTNIALQVLNSGSTAQKAAVETMSNGDFQLTTTAMGVVATNLLPAATYVTIGAMAAAINALGNGWGTTMYSGPAGSYANFPTVDLKPLQGAASCLVGGTYIEIAEMWYGWNTCSFWPDESYESSGVASFWRLDEEAGQAYARFPRGQLGIRIDYAAGFAVIPPAVQQACVDLVQWKYQMSNRDFSLHSEKLGVASYELANPKDWPSTIKQALSRFVAHDRTVYWD